MTAVAIVAVMIVAAFAVIGMADSGAADESTNTKEKNILGTRDNPYILHYSSDAGKNETVTASIEFNRFAFSNAATTRIVCNWQEPRMEYTAKELTKGSNTLSDIDNKNRYIIKLTPQGDENKTGLYSLTFQACKETENPPTEFRIDVLVKDKVTSGSIELPEQKYTFKAYIKAVDASNKSITLEGAGVTDYTEVDVPKQKINFEFETDYSITSRVVVNNTADLAESFNYYAVGLPDGISMTVDGKIGGRLSNSLVKHETDQPFTVYAVSASGHVVSKSMTYSIGDKANRGFTISFGGNDYTTTTVNKNVTLTITPTGGSTLKNVVVSYGEHKDTFEDITGITDHEIQCTGTGILKVSVSAQFDGTDVMITKTITVYVVGEIFDTDLDPEVTN